MDSVRTASAAVRSSGTRQCALRRSPSFGALTSSDVRLAARRACAGAISRLLEQGRNFAVEGPDGPLFPAFQFRDVRRARSSQRCATRWAITYEAGRSWPGSPGRAAASTARAPSISSPLYPMTWWPQPSTKCRSPTTEWRTRRLSKRDTPRRMSRPDSAAVASRHISGRSPWPSHCRQGR